MISEKLYTKYANDPAAFRNDLLIDVDGVAKRLGDVVDPWQKKDFKAIDPALLKCVGRSKSEAKMRAYLERPRGHSKTQDLAVTSLWLLAFPTRLMKGYAYAADKDQAALLRDAVQRIVRLNPWLAEIISVGKDFVSNIAKKHPGKNSTLKIETSDVSSSYGILADFIIADEFVHWLGDGSLWDSLISSAAKKKNCLLFGISNAGFVDSWQWRIREIIRTDDAWYFSRLDGPQASWMNDKRLDEQKRMLPTVAYLRLWENQWSSGGGDALLPSDIDAAFRDGLAPMTGNEVDWDWVAGVDLGLTRDCSAVVTLAVGSHGTRNADRIRLAAHRLWKPIRGKKINLTEVENYIRDLDQKFQLECCAFDPWQAEHLAQRLEFNKKARSEKKFGFDDEPWMRSVPPSGSTLRDIASLTIESFTDRRLELYPCEPLRQDLHKLRVEEKSYGYRLISPRDSEGHGDSFSAFSLALHIGHETAGKKPVFVGVIDWDSSGVVFPSTLAQIHEHERELAQQPYDRQEEFRNFMKRHFPNRMRGGS